MTDENLQEERQLAEFNGKQYMQVFTNVKVRFVFITSNCF